MRALRSRPAPAVLLVHDLDCWLSRSTPRFGAALPPDARLRHGAGADRALRPVGVFCVNRRPIGRRLTAAAATLACRPTFIDAAWYSDLPRDAPGWCWCRACSPIGRDAVRTADHVLSAGSGTNRPICFPTTRSRPLFWCAGAGSCWPACCWGWQSAS